MWIIAGAFPNISRLNSEFAKLRAFRACVPYVPTRQRALRAYTPYVPTCLRALHY